MISDSDALKIAEKIEDADNIDIRQQRAISVKSTSTVQ